MLCSQHIGSIIDGKILQKGDKKADRQNRTRAPEQIIRLTA